MEVEEGAVEAGDLEVGGGSGGPFIDFTCGIGCILLSIGVLIYLSYIAFGVLCALALFLQCCCHSFLNASCCKTSVSSFRKSYLERMATNYYSEY